LRKHQILLYTDIMPHALGDTDWQDWLRLTIILIVLIIGGAEILRM